MFTGKLYTSILDFNFKETGNFDKLYIKSPKNIKIKNEIINKIYEKIIKNKNKISFKEIDDILLKTTFSCSLSFHNMISLNKDEIINFNSKNIKKEISNIIIETCMKDKQFPKVGKSTNNVFNKIKSISNAFNFNLINGDIRKLCFLFIKDEIKQTKLIIKNFFKDKNLEFLTNFPKLLIKHNNISEMSEIEFFILLNIILKNFYSKKIEIKNYKNEYKILINIMSDKLPILLFRK